MNKKLAGTFILIMLSILLLSGATYAYEDNSSNTSYTDSDNEGSTAQEDISVEENVTAKGHITYHDRNVVPENTAEKNYEKNITTNEKTENITVKDYPSNPDISMPFYMDDNSTAICVEPFDHLPLSGESTYNVDYSNHTILNIKTGENVTDYIKIYIYNHMNNPEETFCRNDSSYTVESSLRWGVWSFILYDYNSDTYPDVMAGFLKSAVEETLNYYKEHGPVDDEGILDDGITHYKIYFLSNTNENHFQNLIAYKTWLEDKCNMSWAWKLENHTTTDYVNETYLVNTTRTVPYNVTENYTENVTEYVEKTVTENYTVNITREVPYNTTVTYPVNVTEYINETVSQTYPVNVTVTVPYNVTENYTEEIVEYVDKIITENYTVNVTRSVPYNVTRTDVKNITVNVPVNRTVNYTVMITREVPYNVTTSYEENVTEFVKRTVVENYTINTTREVPYNTTEYYLDYETKKVPVNKTEYVNVTKNVTVNIDEPVVKNVASGDTKSYTVTGTRDNAKYDEGFKGSGKGTDFKKDKTGTHNISGKTQSDGHEIYAENSIQNKSTTKTQTILVPQNVTTYEDVTYPVNRTRTVTKYETVIIPEIRQRNITVYEPVTTTVTKNRTVTLYKNVTEPVIRQKNITSYEDKVIEVKNISTITIYRNETVPVTSQRNVTVKVPQTITVNKTRIVTMYRNDTVEELRERNVTRTVGVTREVNVTENVTKYMNVTEPVVKQKNVTTMVPVVKEVNRTRIVTKYRSVPVVEKKIRQVPVYSYQYKLYIYLLYLEGNITFEDLVAIIGEESIQFNADGSIELVYSDIDDVPSSISVIAADDDSSDELRADIPETDDDVNMENPDNLDDPVMDAGIVNAEL